jgi:hypothetical protein
MSQLGSICNCYMSMRALFWQLLHVATWQHFGSSSSKVLCQVAMGDFSSDAISFLHPGLLAHAGLAAYVRFCSACSGSVKLDLTRSQTGLKGLLRSVTVCPSASLLCRMSSLALCVDSINLRVHTLSEFRTLLLIWPSICIALDGTDVKVLLTDFTMPEVCRDAVDTCFYSFNHLWAVFCCGGIPRIGDLRQYFAFWVWDNPDFVEIMTGDRRVSWQVRAFQGELSDTLQLAMTRLTELRARGLSW